MQEVDFFALTTDPIPQRLHGTDSKCAIRSLYPKERLGIEDQFFKNGVQARLDPNTTAVVISRTFNDDDDLEERAILVEFALSILTISGFQPIRIAADFVNGDCNKAAIRHQAVPTLAAATFATSLEGAGATSWIVRFLNARNTTPDRMHITADRFVRYSQGRNLKDGLMDLCISLESLLESQSEVSFRFGVCLTKVTRLKGKQAEETARLLSALYDLRSKLAHGDPAASKLLDKIKPSLVELRRIARSILTYYVLYLSEHSRPEWKQHLNTLLYT